MSVQVVVLATTLPARRGDGTPEFVLTLASEVANQGNIVTIVAPRVPGSLASEWIGSVHVVRFRYFPRRWEDLASGAIVPNLKQRPSRWLQVLPLLLSYWWTARRESRKADIIHAHWIIPGGLVARLLGLPYVVTAHGADAYALSGVLVTRLKRFVLRGASAVVPVSQDISSRLRLHGCEPSCVLPMGIDAQAIRILVGDRQPLRGRVLFVGRLVDKKGVDDLLRAVAPLHDVRLTLVGDGQSRRKLERLASSLGLDDRVEFRGTLTRTGVLQEMSRAAVIALPSKVGEGGDTDGVPVVIPEAIAAGVPIVASDAGGLADHLRDGDSAWVVPSGDVARLSLALKAAVGDPDEGARRAARARELVLPTFRIERVGAEYSKILGDAGRRGTRSP